MVGLVNFKIFNNKKGIITTLELITVIVTIFLSFSIFFPEGGYRDNWPDAYAYLMSKDALATLVATGNLNYYMSNESKMQEFFDNIGGPNYIFWYRIEEIKDEITIACDCPDEAMNSLNNWVSGLRFNDRDINIFFCKADVNKPESSCMKGSDGLIIWGFKSLDEQTLLSYLIENRGIIEMTDFNSPPDAVQQKVFGIEGGGVWGIDGDLILEPVSPSQTTYEPHKFFYNIPLSLLGKEKTYITNCNTSWKGAFGVRENLYSFWVCNGSSTEPYVYFNRNENSLPDSDELFGLGEIFSLDTYNFNLSYIDSENKIRVTFMDSPRYRFSDFIRPPAGGVAIRPTNDDEERVFIEMGGTADNTACGVVLNSVHGSRTAWVANFSRNGLDMVGDDHRQLLISLIIWISRKHEGSEYILNLRRGYTSSYISAKDIDMLEINKYDIGVGYPY